MRRKIKGPLNRERILDATIAIFAENGFGGASLEAVARKAKLTKAAVLYHFSSKESLLCEAAKKVVSHNLELVRVAVDESQPAIKQLETYYLASLRWATDYPAEARLMLLLFFQAPVHEESAQVSHLVLSRGLERVQNFLLAAQREGAIDKNANVKELATAIHDSIVAAAMRISGPDRALPAREFIALRMRIWKSWLTPSSR